MSSSSVWVQLYYKGDSQPNGQPVNIKPLPEHVSGLKAAALPKLDPSELAEVFVYPPGTTPPFSQVDALNAWDTVPLNSSGPQPLIVVAPAPKQKDDRQEEDPRLQKVVAFVEAEMDDRTKNKPMSEASQNWAETILAAYGIKHDRLKMVVPDLGSSQDPQPYQWTIQTDQGETWDKYEHRGTPGALNWIKENFLVSNDQYDLKVVTGANLPKVKGNRRSATGKTDIVIGDKNDIHKGSTFDFAMGIIELKTNTYPLKVGQNLLQLLALSMASTFKKAVVLLATDCNAKWEVFSFSDGGTIISKVYWHGSKAWDDFLQLLKSSEDRNFVSQKTMWFPSLPQVAEQDLAGFEMSDRDKKKAKAEEDEAMLEHFADQMADIYGERPTIPWWARAKARIPDYYA